MKTLQSISALFIVLLLAMSGNTTPISIAHGSLDLEHMKISTTLEDAPGISAGGSSFYCDLKGKDKYFTSGDYLKIFHKYLYLYNPPGISGGCGGYFTESMEKSDGKIDRYIKKGVINCIFSKPFCGNLQIHGFHRPFCGENSSASVPEPGLIGLLISGITAVFATGVIRKKKGAL